MSCVATLIVEMKWIVNSLKSWLDGSNWLINSESLRIPTHPVSSGRVQVSVSDSE